MLSMTRSPMAPPPPPLLLLLWVLVAAEPPPAIDTSALDYGSFLQRHDLSWDWTWDASSVYTLQPRAAELSHCGSGGDTGACCLVADVVTGGVSLAECDGASPAQQWRLHGTGQYECGGYCLSDAGGGKLLTPCATEERRHDSSSSSSSSSTTSAGVSDPSKQSWRSIDGYIFNTATTNCLQILTNTSFCTGTVCPLERAVPFTAGAIIGTSQSNNGDRSQLFAAYTLPSAGTPRSAGGFGPGQANGRVEIGMVQNRIPTTWTTSAYAGNGLLGIRIAAEAGSSGVLRLYMDRADLGEYGHREPTGYFRLTMPNTQALPLHVQMRQSLYDATVTANITDATAAATTTATEQQPLLSLILFVDASSLTNNGSAVYLTVDYQHGYEPLLDWVACSSSGNSVGCGPAALNATQSSTLDGVELTVHRTVKSGGGNMSWASGWRWIDTGDEPTMPTDGGHGTDDQRQQKTAVALIAACGTPACNDGSLGALCPCSTTLSTSATTNAGAVHESDDDASGEAAGIDPAQACAAGINAAAARGVVVAFEMHKAWWSAYWPQSFVSLPITRIEGYYYTQMYRFPSSDRVGLHGLMGAFGPSGMFDLWPDDVWDMNEQVMYWLAAASNRPAIADPMIKYMESSRSHGGGYNGGKVGGLWMVHNYHKIQSFRGNLTNAADTILAMIKAGLPSNKTLGGLEADHKYHIEGCASPEYRCFPPFDTEPNRTPQCKIDRDCTYALSQLRWGLSTALQLVVNHSANASSSDVAWWRELQSKLVGYPIDNETGFRLSSNCSFLCPHRHFSHLLQVYDLENSAVGVDPSLDAVIYKSIDNFYRVSCNESNWFNEECRGFTQCGLASMNAVSGRRRAAAGNLTKLVDTVITPNGMYGEMVFFHHPDEFCPVSESAYCGAGSVHTMLLHTTADGVLQLFPGLPSEWRDARFHQLRASRGLTVSAVRRNGSMDWMHLTAPPTGRGVPEGARTTEYTFAVPDDSRWMAATPHALPAGTVVAHGRRTGVWVVSIAENESVALWPADTQGQPELVMGPLPGNESEFNYWGYNHNMQPLH